VTRRDVPPIEFDGLVYWYVEWFDPAADLCCVCREPIPEEDVPLILFKEREAQTITAAGAIVTHKQTLQARVHFDPCAHVLIEGGRLRFGPAH
jgi:hypothetical protein